MILDRSPPDWDGYGAVPVDRRACEIAREIIRLLPETETPPDIGADPDGEVGFEWIIETRWRFSFSISGEGRLSYAGLFGRSKAHGVDFFHGENPCCGPSGKEAIRKG